MTDTRITKSMAKEPGVLETLWHMRGLADRRLFDHLDGVDCDPETWAAVNTPDEAWQIEDESKRPSAVWKARKDEWFAAGAVLGELAAIARRNVRIATGHEPIRNLI
jgi:hypothetical protein